MTRPDEITTRFSRRCGGGRSASPPLARPAAETTACSAAVRPKRFLAPTSAPCASSSSATLSVSSADTAPEWPACAAACRAVVPSQSLAPTCVWPYEPRRRDSSAASPRSAASCSDEDTTRSHARCAVVHRFAGSIGRSVDRRETTPPHSAPGTWQHKSPLVRWAWSSAL
eukprot:scaffold42424_cov53-Phaeocystis_antarctica.AAC.2